MLSQAKPETIGLAGIYSLPPFQSSDLSFQDDACQCVGPALDLSVSIQIAVVKALYLYAVELETVVP